MSSPGEPLVEPEFPAPIRELSHLDEDTKDTLQVQGTKIPKWDILISQEKGESWCHKQAQFNCPTPGTERDPGAPHTPPLTPSCVQSSLGAPPTGRPLLQSWRHCCHPTLPGTASGGSACYRVFLLLKGRSLPMTSAKASCL